MVLKGVFSSASKRSYAFCNSSASNLMADGESLTPAVTQRKPCYKRRPSEGSCSVRGSPNRDYGEMNCDGNTMARAWHPQWRKGSLAISEGRLRAVAAWEDHQTEMMARWIVMVTLYIIVIVRIQNNISRLLRCAVVVERRCCLLLSYTRKLLRMQYGMYVPVYRIPLVSYVLSDST
jgi:hypothetical protein